VNLLPGWCLSHQHRKQKCYAYKVGT
jgi:hypothetical protein